MSRNGWVELGQDAGPWRSTEGADFAGSGERRRSTDYTGYTEDFGWAKTGWKRHRAPGKGQAGMGAGLAVSAGTR